jgi:hypothetical protein
LYYRGCAGRDYSGFHCRAYGPCGGHQELINARRQGNEATRQRDKKQQDINTLLLCFFAFVPFPMPRCLDASLPYLTFAA